jgi:hypothetical protein
MPTCTLRHVRFSLPAVLATVLAAAGPAHAALYTGTTTIYESPDPTVIPVGASATVTALIGDEAQPPEPGSPEAGYLAFYVGTLTLDVLDMQFTSRMNVWVNCTVDSPCADRAAAASCFGDVTNVTLSWNVPVSLPWTGGQVPPQYACIGANDPQSTQLPAVIAPEIVIPLMDRVTGVPLPWQLEARTVPLTRAPDETDVPEPTSLLLVAIALATVVGRSSRRSD